MGFAALLILGFHLYIPFSHHIFELSIQRAAYIGVDLFFFLSAYSLGRKESISFFSFIKNRFFSIYVPFIVFAVIAFFYKRWKFARLLKVIFSIEFFQRGGGAFLWFTSGIMLLYSITPFLIKAKKKFGIMAFLFMLLGWMSVAVVLQYCLNYTTIFILINRLPVFFIGLYYDELRGIAIGKLKIPAILTGIFIGVFLLFQYGSITKLNRPLSEFYYIIAIPFVFSFVVLCDFVAETVKIRNVPLNFVGKISFELYGSQMIFGYDMESFFMKTTKNGQISFLLTCFSLIVIAYLFHQMFVFINERKRKNKK